MSTKPLAKTTTLKRSRAQADDQDDNDIGNKGSPDTPFLRGDSHMDEERWQESLYSYSLHDNKTPRDVTWMDPRADSKLQDALKFLPPKAQLDALIEAFFSNVNHHYNIINPPTFIRQYVSWSKQRPQGCCQDLHLTTLILMICACVTQHLDIDSQTALDNHLDQPPRKGLSNSYHDAGQRLAKAIPASSYHLTNLQWKVLSICWLKGEAKFTEAWHTIGLAVQEAYELGLHKSRPSRTTPDTKAEIGGRVWQVLYCWNWQLSSTLGRPFLMNDIDSEPEEPCSDLKHTPPTPTLHTKLQYRLISSLAKRWQTPQNVNSPSEIYIYKRIVEDHISSLPSVFAIYNTDTSSDDKWPWVVTHRSYIQTMAYFMILQPYKACLLHPSTDLSLPMMQELRAEAVKFSLKTLQIATQWASQVSQGDGQFHLVVLCLFDTAAFLSISLCKGHGNAFPQRDKAILAVTETAAILKQLQSISQGAKSSHMLLYRILQRLEWS